MVSVERSIGVGVAVVMIGTPLSLSLIYLKGELRTRRRKNLVQARSFVELMEQSLRRYQNRAIEAPR